MRINIDKVRIISASSEKETKEEYCPNPPKISKPALQKAEIDINTAVYSPWERPKSGIKRVASKMLPNSSIITVPATICLVRRTIPLMSDVLKLSFSKVRSFKVICRFNTKEIAVISVIKPMPPIWISTMITVCPNTDQWV